MTFNSVSREHRDAELITYCRNRTVMKVTTATKVLWQSLRVSYITCQGRACKLGRPHKILS